MIIVKFCSGIGNQLYQYAVLVYLQKKYPNEIIKADISVFEDVQVLNKGNGFSYGFGMKEFFGIELGYATNSEIQKVNYEIIPGPTFRRMLPQIASKCVGNSIPTRIRGRIVPKYKRLKKSYITNIPFSAYNGSITQLDTSRDYYLSGLWQNYEYIRPVELELREKLSLKVVPSDYTCDVLKKIDSCNSVCIHIRRGDFTSPSNKFSHDLCGKSYYQRAIKEIESRVENPHFFVFSDDIEYCKGFLAGLKNATFVSGHEGVSTKEEMLLISRCHSAIISNSTFAFWGVWMSDCLEKIVIAPKYSVRGENAWHKFSVPEHWTIIDNLCEE